QSKLHDAKQSIHGLLRKPMAVQLPTNDRKMSIALAAMLATLLYVCALALLVHFVLGHAADGMDTGIRSSMTVEILSATSEQKDWKSAEERLKLVQERLRKLPGVIKAENVPAAHMRDLLKPWLGEKTSLDGLTLPLLLDVQLDPHARIDKNALNKIMADVPGTMLDDHGRFMGQLVAFGKSMRDISFTIMLLGITALILCAYFAAQATFYMNRDMIEILHLIGAEDNAIAQHTGMSILRLMLVSSSVALAFMFITLIMVLSNAAGLDFSFFPNFDIGFFDWLLLIVEWGVLFAFATLFCLLAARFTVLQALRRLL
ncbi:MAG: hypothetical protein EBX50_23630, partial [Chitinophagia bacterium]|nr:hypothetical protein [Chitinophagia bacterium]